MGIYSNIEANIIPIQPLTGHQYIRIQNSLNDSECEGLVTNSVSDLLINIKKVKYEISGESTSHPPSK